MATRSYSIAPTPQLSMPVLAIVGRPNVGKSALFNRIVGRRIAIVHEESGVTRDRVSAVANWHDKTFEAVDTGGIAFMDDEKSVDPMANATRQQAEVAIAMASVLVLVVDVTAGVTPLDLELARKLRSSGKLVLLAVNKVDNRDRENGVAEFADLGLKKIFPIAAIHGLGVDTLIEAATADFRVGPAIPAIKRPRIAIVGRPNVGKSSLVNCVLHSERSIVSDIPGTTRDSIDVPITIGGKDYELVDTAGLRHRRKIASSVDQFGLMRAERSIRNCDVAVLVLDAVAGVTKQDQKIAAQIQEANCGCVILVNKWDLAADEDRKIPKPILRGKYKLRTKSYREEYLAALRRELFFLNWAPVLFASAKTGESVNDLFELVANIDREMDRRVGTPELNRMLTHALASYPPSIVSGKRFKIYYAFQKPGRPPCFTFFVNDGRYLTPHYKRFLIDKIRATWAFTGCPLVLECRLRERREFIKKSHDRGTFEKK